MNILVVEDEVLLASSLKEILEECGHDVICAYDGMEGLELARSSHFDLLVNQISLTGLKGWIRVQTIILQNLLTEGSS